MEFFGSPIEEGKGKGTEQLDLIKKKLAVIFEKANGPLGDLLSDLENGVLSHKNLESIKVMLQSTELSPEIFKLFDNIFSINRTLDPSLLSKEITLFEKEVGKLLSTSPFKTYLENVLSGKFIQERYDIKNSEHLKQVFDSKKGLKEMWSKSPEPQNLEKGVVQAVVTDDPCNLLLIGTEVFSCQHVLKKENKCLLAYLLDSKIKAIVIKNDRNEIQARSIFRLLWDGQQPVLFLEKFYSNSFDKSLAEEVKKYAINAAKEMGLTLVAENGWQEGEEKPYPAKVSSLGGPAPFEYVDALKGIQSSKYEISGDKLIYLHET